MNRLKELYEQKIMPELIEKYGYKNKMQVPRMQKWQDSARCFSDRTQGGLRRRESFLKVSMQSVKSVSKIFSPPDF